jgi:hypothetical protein
MLERVAQREADRRYHALNKERINERRRKRAAVLRQPYLDGKKREKCARAAAVAAEKQRKERERCHAKAVASAAARERRRDYERRYHAQRRDEIAAKKKAYRAGRGGEVEREYQALPHVKLARYLRIRLWCVLKRGGKSKAGSAVELLGCSVEVARTHLERQFTRGMTWENWGEVWHVDHIRALAGFDLTDAAQLAEACHFTNLRPLGKAANLAKGAKREFLI